MKLLPGYGAFTVTYSCGHTSKEQVFPASAAKDYSSSCLCDACNKKEDAARNRICKRLTGETPDGLILRWRLRATEQEVAQALEAAGLCVPDMERDDGTNPAKEKQVHAYALRRMCEATGKCACGCTGSWNHTIVGSIGMEPAIWPGCPRCPGSTAGNGISGCDRFAVDLAIESTARCGEDIDDWITSK